MIRRAHLSELDAVVALRAAMWDDLHPDDRSDEAYRATLRDHFARVLADETVCVWLAEEDAAVVGMATLLLQEWPPRKTGPEIRGYVTAVFVHEQARRRGHARGLMTALLDHARATNLKRVVLRTSDAARRLYESLAFAQREVLAIDLRATSPTR